MGVIAVSIRPGWTTTQVTVTITPKPPDDPDGARTVNVVTDDAPHLSDASLIAAAAAPRAARRGLSR